MTLRPIGDLVTLRIIQDAAESADVTANAVVATRDADLGGAEAAVVSALTAPSAADESAIVADSGAVTAVAAPSVADEVTDFADTVAIVAGVTPSVATEATGWGDTAAVTATATPSATATLAVVDTATVSASVAPSVADESVQVGAVDEAAAVTALADVSVAAARVGLPESAAIGTTATPAVGTEATGWGDTAAVTAVGSPSIATEATGWGDTAPVVATASPVVATEAVGTTERAAVTAVGSPVAAGETATPATQVIDNFEDTPDGPYGSGEGIDDYYSGSVSEAQRQTSTVQSGTHALEFGGTGNYEDIISTSGLANYPEQGDTFEWWVYLEEEGTETNFSGGLFGVQSLGNYYSVHLSLPERELIIRRRENGSNNNLNSAGATIGFDTWYRIETAWGTDDSIDATLYDSGGSELANVSAIDDTWASGGVGFWQNTSDGGGLGPYAFYDGYKLT